MRRLQLKEKTYSLRRFSISDVTSVVQLLNNVFKPPTPFTEEWWHWKYEKNPAGFWGEQGDAWVAEDKGEIVGHYAVIPSIISLYGKTILAGQSVDTAVHPEYRGMGIFGSLAKNVYADIKNRYSFLYGYPTEMAYKGFLGLGWKENPVNDLMMFVNYRRPLESLLSNRLEILSAASFLKVYQSMKRASTLHKTKSKHDEEIVAEETSKFKDDENTLWETRKDDSKIILERTSSFLNWRFSKIFGDYRIWIGKSLKDNSTKGYLVLRKNRQNKITFLDIVDFYSSADGDKLLFTVLDLSLREKDIDIVRMRVPGWHRYSRILAERGFVGLGKILNLVGMYQPKFVTFQINGSQITPKIHDWFYSSADSDYA